MLICEGYYLLKIHDVEEGLFQVAIWNSTILKVLVGILIPQTQPSQHEATYSSYFVLLRPFHWIFD